MHDLAEGMRAIFEWIGVWAVFAPEGPAMQRLHAWLRLRQIKKKAA